MNEQQLLATKEITKIKFRDRTFYRIFHTLGGILTEMTVFELEKNEQERMVSLTEITVEEVPKEIAEAVISEHYAVKMNEYDKELIVEALNTRFKVMKSFAEEKLNLGLKRKLLEFVEVGGHYYGYVYEEGMPYTKFYRLIMDLSNHQLYVQGIHPMVLPALFEAISDRVLKSTTGITVQVDEGVYTRIMLVNPKIALVTVVVAFEDERGNGKMELKGIFCLKKHRKRGWVAQFLNEEEQKIWDKDIRASFDYVYQELLLKLYTVKGDEALNGLE